MQCHGCGCRIPKRGEVRETVSVPSDVRGAYHRTTATVIVTFCPECAATRKRSRQQIYWAVAIFIVGLLALAITRLIWR